MGFWYAESNQRGVQINMGKWMQGEYTLYIHADDQLVQQVVIKM